MKKSKIVIVSGYFNPIHSGHIDYFNAARELGDELWVIVNNDEQVKLKGTVPFMDMRERIKIVKSLKMVNHVFDSVDKDTSVVVTLGYITKFWKASENVTGVEYDFIFANGGDRKSGNTPEEEYCINNGIQTVYGVGAEKVQSSSKLLKNVGLV